MIKKVQEVMVAIAENRQEIVDALVKLSVTDLLFFWGTERELVKEQEKQWLPIIKWLEDVVLHYKLVQTQSLDVPQQNPTFVTVFQGFLDNMSDKKLAVFYVATMTLRSVLLASAFVQKKITSDEAFNAAFVEELWQNRMWGATDEAEEKQKNIKVELDMLEKEI